MLNPYGTSPIAAMWQGFHSTDDPLAVGSVVTRVSYNCTVPSYDFRGPTLFMLLAKPSADDATYIPTVQLFDGVNARGLTTVTPVFGGPPANQIAFTFGALLGNDETLVNIVIWQGLPATRFGGNP